MLAEARQAREDNVDSWRRPLTGPGGSTARRPHRTSLAASQAAKAKIELMELQASLVSRQDVEAAIALALREIHSAFAGRWAVLAVELEGRSAHEIETLCRAADEKLLGELVRRFEQIGAV